MSNWTHVAGIVRVDSIRCIMPEPNWKKIFGKELHYEDDIEIWKDAENNPDDYLPMGSEGSLEMTIWENPSINDCFSYVVSIFGDLRDHDSSEEIIKWFEDKVKNNGLIIRQAVITVENEVKEILSWTYEDDED